MANDQGEKPFFFKLEGDETGITALSFKKDSEHLHAVLLEALTIINQSFSAPFQSVGDLCRHLGEVSDNYDRMIHERNNQRTNVSQRATEEICGKETCDGLCAVDGCVCPECNQGRVPPSGG